MAICLLLSGACAAPEPTVTESTPHPAAAAHGGETHQGCPGFGADPPFTMGWAEHADDGVVRRGATARLAFTNKADVAIEAHLTLIVRADGRVLEKPLGKQTVGPRSSTVVAADVAVAGLRASELAYSAQIMVVASMFVDGERLPGGVSTEPLYYHAEAESGALLVYGDRAYREQFGAGDFRQRRVRTAGEPEIDGIGVAHFATSEELVGDPADGPIGVPAEGKR